MFLKILILLSIIFTISCNSKTTEINNNSCNNNVCTGDIRFIDCPNIKPDDSYWEEVNPNGKIKQIYNGEIFIPKSYNCLWSCNINYEKINNNCKLNCQSGYERINGECKAKNTSNDSDNDGIPDSEDNCKDIYNQNQSDTDNNGIGDVCEIQNGSWIHPFIIDSSQTYNDTQNTQNSNNSLIDSYPPNTLNENGPEYYYIFKLNKTTKIKAYIDNPEPNNTDIDLHLLKTLTPLKLITRANYQIEATLNKGIYYIVMDSYNDNGIIMSGNYNLTIEFTPDYAGTVDEPIELGTLSLPFNYGDSRNTKNAQSLFFDSYPPNELNEGGHEYIYHFKVDENVRFNASINYPEPNNTDIDIHLISSLDTSDSSFLIERGNYSVYSRLEPGDYYLVMDSYVNSDGDILEGNYKLNIMVNPIEENNDTTYFNYYILEAVDYLYANYRLLGYASANLTHDINYGDSDINSEGHYGVITRSGGARTMCVSAQMEIILTAMQLYAEDTGDYSIYEFLPKDSWTKQDKNHIKGHIWVNYSYSNGTGDALSNFGMGVTNGVIEFEDLKPGGFINLNRTTGTGHATTFLAFLDSDGNEYNTYPTDNNIQIIGFKYFSSQGRYDVGKGGFDYRWAIFSDYGTPSFCSYKKCDKNIIFSRRENYLNVGMMLSPDNWDSSIRPNTQKTLYKEKKIKKIGNYLPADPKLWNGLTYYDLQNK